MEQVFSVTRTTKNDGGVKLPCFPEDNEIIKVFEHRSHAEKYVREKSHWNELSLAEQLNDERAELQRKMDKALKDEQNKIKKGESKELILSRCREDHRIQLDKANPDNILYDETTDKNGNLISISLEISYYHFKRKYQITEATIEHESIVDLFPNDSVYDLD